MEKLGRQMPYALEPEKCAGRLDFSNPVSLYEYSQAPSTNFTARPLRQVPY